MADFPSLDAERLTLRALTKQDAPALLAIYRDVEVTRWLGADPLTTLEQAEQLIDLFAGWRNSTNPATRWAIVERAHNRLIGTCGLFKWNRCWKSCSIGFELAYSAQGQGFMREAIISCVKWGFSQMALNRIDALVHPANTRSLRLLEKLGFMREGVLRQAGFWSGGHHDLTQLSLLRSECEFL